jgi:hypothetical protein
MELDIPYHSGLNLLTLSQKAKMNKIKILINSSPRSAHAWFQAVLLNSIGREKKISQGDIDDQFVIRSNTPAMLFGKFDDIIQTTILRDPASIIPSIVTKTMGGLGTTTTAGIAMPHEYSKNIDLNGLIDHQFSVYKRWVDGVTNNLDRVLPFTFDQVVNDIEFCVKTVLDNFDIEYYLYSNDELPGLLDNMSKQIRIHDKGDIGFNNALPVDKKPEIYYKAFDIIQNHSKLQNATNMYNNAVDLIYKTQETYG